MYYLFLDTECGGLDESTSLLELGLIVTTKDFNIVEEIEWKIKPDDGIYNVTAQALEVNGIDLKYHDKVAKPYKEVSHELYSFLQKWYYASGVVCKKYIPVGKNIAFDCQRIFKYLMSKGTWEVFVSYQPLELNGAWRLCEAQGKVPALPKTSLGDLANYFNIPVKNLHTANGDNHLYIEIMKRLVQL